MSAGREENDLENDARNPSLDAMLDVSSLVSLVVDIGGEGRHEEAWNVNPRRYKTVGSKRNQPIPRLIVGRAENLPFPDQSADKIIVERTPLSRLALNEIKRIAKPGALVVLRHAQAYAIDPHRLAKQVLQGERRECECKIGAQSYQETIIKLERV